MPLPRWLGGRPPQADTITEEESWMGEETGRTWQPKQAGDNTEAAGGQWTDQDVQRAQEAIDRARAEQQGDPEEQVATGSHAEQPEQRRVTPAADNPIIDTGEMYVPQEERLHSEVCSSCGRPLPDDHELLVEVKAWLAPHGAAATSRFYARLFEVAPQLRSLFPDDIKIQEEKLLSAIVALLDLFQAGDTEMEQLNSALSRFGRSHTRFDPAATIEEYAAVKAVLFDVVGEQIGDRLTERHAAALTRAYEYAAGMMLAAQATARLHGVGRRRRTV